MAVYTVLGGGLTLGVVKPYSAFLLSVVLLAAGHTDKFTQTRTDLLGPYLNLTDACVLVAVVSFFFDRIAARRTIKMPEIVPLMLLVLVVAASQTFWKLGWTYETLRAFRWAISLPLGFFLGANMVTSDHRARRLVETLVVGAVLAAIQHVFFVAGIWRSRSLSMENYQLMRTIGYSGSRAASFLLTAIVWGLPRELGRKVLHLFIGLLLVATLVLNQTRSLWFAMVGAVPCLVILFKARGALPRIAKLAAVGAVVMVALVAGLQRVLPGLNVMDLFSERMESLVDQKTAGVHVGTRERSLTAEMGRWFEGTLVFGRGLYFYQTLDKADEDPRYRIAFGHLGYVTYLSQLGVIGLLVYGALLPVEIVRRSRRLWHEGETQSVRYLGLFGGACIIHASLLFFMSSHYLSVSSFVPGVVFGGVWGLAEKVREVSSDNIMSERVICDV
jgi:O-antigen ligase